MQPQKSEQDRKNEVNRVLWAYNRNLQVFNLDQCIDGWYDVLPIQQWKKVLKFQMAQVNIISLTKIIDFSWTSLQQIALYKSQFGSKGLKLLLKANMSQLLKLKIISCGISGEAIKHISKGNWPKLQQIMLINGIHGKTNYVGLQSNHMGYCCSRNIRSVYIMEGISIALIALLVGLSWDTSQINGVYDQLNHIQNEYMKEQIQRIFDTRLTSPR